MGLLGLLLPWGASRGTPRASVGHSGRAVSRGPTWAEALKATCGLSRGAVGPGLGAGPGQQGNRFGQGAHCQALRPVSPSEAPPPYAARGGAQDNLSNVSHCLDFYFFCILIDFLFNESHHVLNLPLHVHNAKGQTR